MINDEKLILVGDNPFQGVSHLSQEKALQRNSNISDAKFDAQLVLTSLGNGANGFTFTSNETALSIIEEINKTPVNINYYPLVPNVSEMVRIAASAGGIPGLTKEMAKKVIMYMDSRLLLNLIKGTLLNKPSALFQSYILYEYHRLIKVIGERNRRQLKAILLHEVVTDMALALNMRWIFKTHIELMCKLGLQAGFETRNFSYFVKMFKEWEIDTSGIVIEAPFNGIGFQMCPSKEECEQALLKTVNAQVIAISILAAGYIKPPEAFEYAATLSGLSGLAIGVSNEKQAEATFQLANRFYNKE
jgi:hypothetical protein